MKKHLQQGLLSAVILSLVACGGSDGDDDSTTPNNPSSTSSSLQESSASAETESSAAPSSTPATSSTATTSSTAETSSSLASSSTASSSAPVLTGVFLDSAVSGIGYRTSPGNKTGRTDAQGRYEYDAGDKVTFYIGDLKLPEVDAKGVITPLDLANTDELNNQVVINIAILLQSLDQDGDPSNGISIDYELAAETATSVDFDQASSSFVSTISSLVTAVGGTAKTAEQAQEHLQSTVESISTLTAEQLVGTWLVEESDYRLVIAFLDATRYVSIEEAGEEGTNMEVGTYVWNASTGVINATPVGEVGETDLGLNSDAATYVIKATNNTLLISEEGDDSDGVPMVKLSSDNGLEGGWYMASDGVMVLSAFTGSHYLMGQYEVDVTPDDVNGQNGIEYGSYSYNETTKEFRVTTITDTNGQWGFSHPCAILDVEESNNLNCAEGGGEILQTMSREGSKLTFISEADTIVNGGEEQPDELDSVDSTTDKAVEYLDLTITNVVTAASAGESFSIPGATMQCLLDGDEVGASETFNETWALDPNYGMATVLYDIPSEEVTDKGFYDPVFKKLRVRNPGAKIDLCAAGEAECSNGVIYYGQNSYEWEADVNLENNTDPVATGVITETRRLTWNQGSQVSTCSITYSMSAEYIPQ